MSVTPCDDTSAAGWILQDPQPWDRLVTMGPAGLPAYARLRFLPDPTHPGQSEDDAPEAVVHTSETEQMRRVLHVLTAFTTTPERCCFLLWDGWGITAFDQDDDERANPRGGGDWRHPDVAALRAQHPSGVVEPGVQPRREQSPAHRPGAGVRAALVRLPHRDHHLFEGTVDDLGDWGPALPLRPFESAPVPAFVWPADHAWCLTRDVDPHYAGIGAPRAAVDALLQVPDLDVVRADPTQQQPSHP
ncbi:hypothetical protein GCM10027586_01290 [Kineococcus gypseus]|uniref:hypothetical protein n=1 Tax=Kineococcus gypseus TaxID=1637102 RepID=UPI003D7E963F